MRTRKQIEDQQEKALQSRDDGGKYHGLSYEDGVEAALAWALEDSDELPMEEE